MYKSSLCKLIIFIYKIEDGQKNKISIFDRISKIAIIQIHKQTRILN